MAVKTVKTGLTPSRKVASGPHGSAMDSYPIVNGYATAIGCGDPVKLVAGLLEKAANGDSVVGVFLGCRYVDANGTPVWSRNYPGNITMTSGQAIDGFAQPVALVLADPKATFLVRFDGTAGVPVRGASYGLTIGSANAVTRNAEVLLDVTETSDVMVQVIDLPQIDGNILDEEGAVAEVRFLNHALGDARVVAPLTINASDVVFDNNGTDIAATDVQGALAELDAEAGA